MNAVYTPWCYNQLPAVRLSRETMPDKSDDPDVRDGVVKLQDDHGVEHSVRFGQPAYTRPRCEDWSGGLPRRVVFIWIPSPDITFNAFLHSR